MTEKEISKRKDLAGPLILKGGQKIMVLVDEQPICLGTVPETSQHIFQVVGVPPRAEEKLVHYFKEIEDKHGKIIQVLEIMVAVKPNP